MSARIYCGSSRNAQPWVSAARLRISRPENRHTGSRPGRRAQVLTTRTWAQALLPEPHGVSTAKSPLPWPPEPVARVGEFATAGAAISCPNRRDRLARSTPVRRSISRWLLPADKSVRTVIRRCGFKTFTPRPRRKRDQRNVRPQIDPRRRPALDQFRGGGISSGLGRRKMGGRRGGRTFCCNKTAPS